MGHGGTVPGFCSLPHNVSDRIRPDLVMKVPIARPTALFWRRIQASKGERPDPGIQLPMQPFTDQTLTRQQHRVLPACHWQD